MSEISRATGLLLTVADSEEPMASNGSMMFGAMILSVIPGPSSIALVIFPRHEKGTQPRL